METAKETFEKVIHFAEILKSGLVREMFNAIRFQLSEWAWKICCRFGLEGDYENLWWGSWIRSFSEVSPWLCAISRTLTLNVFLTPSGSVETTKALVFSQLESFSTEERKKKMLPTKVFIWMFSRWWSKLIPGLAA